MRSSRKNAVIYSEKVRGNNQLTTLFNSANTGVIYVYTYNDLNQ